MLPEVVKGTNYEIGVTRGKEVWGINRDMQSLESQENTGLYRNIWSGHWLRFDPIHGNKQMLQERRGGYLCNRDLVKFWQLYDVHYLPLQNLSQSSLSPLYLRNNTYLNPSSGLPMFQQIFFLSSQYVEVPKTEPIDPNLTVNNTMERDSSVETQICDGRSIQKSDT